jgi:hypothetical protein
MARAIIRYSFDNETSNASGRAIGTVLQDAGFVKQGTACWEATGAQLVLIHAALLQALDICQHPREAQGRLDHLWVYIDDPDSAPQGSPASN